MHQVTRRRIALCTVVAVLVATVAAVVGYVVWPRHSDFEEAAALLPDDTLRVTWTDWARVRDELGGDDFASVARDRELTASSLAYSAPDLKRSLGFDPTRADWEILGQARDGMLLVLKLPGDLGEVADAFASAGYEKPGSKAMDGGVWAGGPDVVAELGLTTGELQNVAFVESEGLLVASDSKEYLASSMKVVRGDEDGLDVTPLTDGLDQDPLDATAFLDDHACEALAMSQADEDAQTVADDLIDEAGGVAPLEGYLVAVAADQRLSVVFAFADDEQAEREATSRAALLTAEDPGQMIAYSDVVTDASTEQDDARVVITGTVKADGAPMSNLAAGPVLLASC